MFMNEELVEPSVYSKLFAVQSEMPTIPKTATNPHFKSKYADLPTIMTILQPILAKHRVLLLQPILNSEHDSIITICTRFIDIDSGKGVSAVTTMPIGNNKTPQAFGSAITYARRYSLCSFLGIVADEDDDGSLTVDTGKLSQAQLKKVFAAGTKAGYSHDDMLAKLRPKGIFALDQMSSQMASAFITYMEAHPLSKDEANGG
jgi:hypothetical protein